MHIGLLRNNASMLKASLNQPAASYYKMTAVKMLGKPFLHKPTASLYLMTAVNMLRKSFLLQPSVAAINKTAFNKLYSSSSTFFTFSCVHHAVYQQTLTLTAPNVKQLFSTSTPDDEKLSHTEDKKPILTLEEHRAIRNSLNKKNSLDLLVHYILDKNILVSSLALENSLLWISPKRMSKTLVASTFKSESLLATFKIAKFTSKTDEIILNRWETLLKSVKVSKEDAIKAVIKAPWDNDDSGIKNNIIGYYVSQGLNEDRLAAEVFQRLKKLLVSGNFSKKEDQIVLQFIKENGTKWTELSKILGRRPDSLFNRFKILNNKKASLREGLYNIEHDVIIITKVFKSNSKILETDGNVNVGVMQNLGHLLNRPVRSVQTRWRQYLEPILRRHHAGTLDVDIKEKLITYLVESDLDFSQDIDWDKLAKMPEYAGHTSSSLIQNRHNLLVGAARKLNVNYTHITASDLKLYWDNSTRRKNIRTKNQQKHLEAVLDFYTSNT